MTKKAERPYVDDELVAIRDKQSGGKEGKDTIKRMKEATSGDPDTQWWKVSGVYEPDSLPDSIADIPKYCFLSDRAVAFVGENISKVTNKQRHLWWPGA